MSVLPYYFDRVMGDTMRDLATIDRTFQPYWPAPRHTTDYCMGVGPVVDDADKFAVSVDVSHFKPDELQVKTDDNQLVIEGHHKETKDNHGYIERSFVRKYHLPANVRPESVFSQLSSDGKLTVQAPKQSIAGSTRRTIPIQQVPAQAAVQQAANDDTDAKKKK
jgi:HSP20 family molecular chaperone IbpA